MVDIEHKITQLLKEQGVSILTGDFKEIWSEDPLKCKYCVPILSKSYIQQDLVEELKFLLVGSQRILFKKSITAAAHHI
jgi:hypothetical protein